MPPQRSARRENCLSAKREFFPGSAARMCMVEKRSATLPKAIAKIPYFPQIISTLEAPGGMIG